MPRNRLLHPEQTVDEDVNALSIHARYVWVFLPCHADREGRLADKPFALKHQVLPVDEVDMDALLQELARRGLIHRYAAADGRRYIQVRTFLKHQRPHKHEVASTFPPYDPSHVSATPDQGPASPVHVATTPDQGSALPDHKANRGVKAMSLHVPAAPDQGSRLPALSGSGSGSGDPLPSARACDPGRTEQGPVAPPPPTTSKLSGYEIQLRFGRRRAAVLGGTPWASPSDPNGKATTFAEGLTPETAADLEPAMDLFFAHVKARDPGWEDVRLTSKTAFAFGAFVSSFPDLREELHGNGPPPAPKPKVRPGEVHYDEIT